MKEYDRFLSIALGSLGELETQLLLIIDFGYINNDSIKNILSLAEEVGRLLGGLIKKINT